MERGGRAGPHGRGGRASRCCPTPSRPAISRSCRASANIAPTTPTSSTMRSSRRRQIGEAMKIIARVRPKVLVINGGDGTVQAALTELYNGGHFGDKPPPVAVLPSGKTNLIALDLGARGDPIETLERLIELARTDLAPLHRRARTDRAAPRRRRRGAAGDRHVPRRRGACRHDALLPRARSIRWACPTASRT